MAFVYEARAVSSLTQGRRRVDLINLSLAVYLVRTQINSAQHSIHFLYRQFYVFTW